jgi:predicted phosphodiesterase
VTFVNARHAAAVERVAVITDIHANPPALDAVLAADRSGVEAVYCGGDLVGQGPHPRSAR